MKTAKRINHGESKTRLYTIWQRMKSRCYDENNNRFEHYGARNIKVCEEWVNNFPNFKKWSLNNGYSDKLTIDRINNDLDYEPSNCRWASYTTQARNCKVIRKTNTSGYKGASFHKTRKRWRAHISIDDKLKTLGTFKDAKHAALAYDTFVIVYGLEHSRNFP
ncbi:MAG: hypothetical protein R3254_08750 [Thiomicrorhabdus sp.]|nr:hypothetical protein [Thiomicrorhabdus sp.]